MIKVGDDVVVLKDREDADLVHHISALFLREAVQLHLLPHYKGVVLRYSAQCEDHR